MRAFAKVKGLAQLGVVAALLLAGPRIGLAQQGCTSTTSAVQSIVSTSPQPTPRASSNDAAPGQADSWRYPTPRASSNDAEPQILDESILVQERAGAASGTAVEAGQTVPPAAQEESSFWSKVPPVVLLPRTGWFTIPPSGPGYYSLKDYVLDNYRQAPPHFPYPPISLIFNSFFDADYRYLEDPNNTQFDWVDPIKRIHMGDDWLLSFGGEERFQGKMEEDSRLSGKDDEYQLLRTRVYGDLWYRDIFRVYVEFIDAQSFNQDLPPLKIDVNHSDIQNMFIDLKVCELDDYPVYIRGGRQELLYGSERLISPLDWANTRRTFQGVKGFWHTDKLDVDAFWVQPVIVDPTHFDSPDDGQQFAGLWTTYRPYKGQSIDLYYLYLDNTRPIATGRFGAIGGFNVSTVGSRYAGDWHHVLWDFEGMYQFGDNVNQGISAGAATTGLGYQFANLPMDPQFWVVNDFASGNHKPGQSSEDGTFNQLFPFGHFYFGFLDEVGRQNIDDLNMQMVLYPENWITTILQYHIFRLDSAKDALYNAGGTVFREDPSGRAGTDVGDEIDLATNFHLSQHQDIFVGYSKLWAGQFIRRTGSARSPEFFYVQYSFKW